MRHLQHQVEDFVDVGRQEGGDPGADYSWGWGGRDDGRRFGPAWLVVATFVHEVWLLLQHANILLNPLCQRLDRTYGVALVSQREKSVNAWWGFCVTVIFRKVTKDKRANR